MPAYAYGDKGSFSFPSVPPDATIEYTVEVLGFSEPQEKEVGDMMFEERLDAAKRTRLQVRSVPLCAHVLIECKQFWRSGAVT